MKRSWMNPLIGIAAMLTLWWAGASAGLVNPILLPSPAAAARALYAGLADGELGHDIAVTFGRTLVAFVIAAAIAIPLGIALGADAEVYRSMEFVVDFFRSTPVSAMFPLFLVLFGVGDRTKIAIAVFGASLVILFNVAYGVMNSRRTRVLAARIMGASRLRTLWDVYFWESLPQTFVGLRNGISIALVVIIVAEMFIGSNDGLGYLLVQSQMTFDMPTLYASIFCAGALGYGLNWLFLALERRYVHWGGK